MHTEQSPAPSTAGGSRALILVLGLLSRRPACPAFNAVVVIGASSCVPLEPPDADGGEHDDVPAAGEQGERVVGVPGGRLSTAAKSVITAPTGDQCAIDSQELPERSALTQR